MSTSKKSLDCIKDLKKISKSDDTIGDRKFIIKFLKKYSDMVNKTKITLCECKLCKEKTYIICKYMLNIYLKMFIIAGFDNIKNFLYILKFFKINNPTSFENFLEDFKFKDDLIFLLNNLDQSNTKVNPILIMYLAIYLSSFIKNAKKEIFILIEEAILKKYEYYKSNLIFNLFYIKIKSVIESYNNLTININLYLKYISDFYVSVIKEPGIYIFDFQSLYLPYVFNLFKETIKINDYSNTFELNFNTISDILSYFKIKDFTKIKFKYIKCACSMKKHIIIGWENYITAKIFIKCIDDKLLDDYFIEPEDSDKIMYCSDYHSTTIEIKTSADSLHPESAEKVLRNLIDNQIVKINSLIMDKYKSKINLTQIKKDYGNKGIIDAIKSRKLLICNTLRTNYLNGNIKNNSLFIDYIKFLVYNMTKSINYFYLLDLYTSEIEAKICSDYLDFCKINPFSDIFYFNQDFYIKDNYFSSFIEPLNNTIADAPELKLELMTKVKINTSINRRFNKFRIKYKPRCISKIKRNRQFELFSYFEKLIKENIQYEMQYFPIDFTID
jgi:hypothetical protein